MKKFCVLDEKKLCDKCGECLICDLDPNKICDNCEKCLQTDADYASIEIDEILFPESDDSDQNDSDDNKCKCDKSKKSPFAH